MGGITYEADFGRVLPDWDAYLAVLKEALIKEVGPELASAMEAEVDWWTIIPDFVVQDESTQAELKVYVEPQGERADVWGYQSGGTEYIDANHYEKAVMRKRLSHLIQILQQANKRGLKAAKSQARSL